jgi:hypothetical protein
MCYVALIPAAMAAFGAMQQSSAQKDQAEYQSKVAQNNATISNYQAQDAVKRGKVAAQDQMQKVAQVKGQQVATLASRGIDIGEGSALALLQDTDTMGKIDTKRILHGAAMDKWGLDIQTSNYNSTANMYDTTAGNINPLMDGLMAGGKSFIGNGGTGSGTISDAWANMWKQKPEVTTMSDKAGP